LYVSDKKEFITKNIDVFIAFDDFGLEKNKKIYNI
jgi:hypothetical protein